MCHNNLHRLTWWAYRYIDTSHQVFKPESSKDLCQMSSIYKGCVLGWGICESLTDGAHLPYKYTEISDFKFKETASAWRK